MEPQAFFRFSGFFRALFPAHPFILAFIALAAPVASAASDSTRPHFVDPPRVTTRSDGAGSWTMEWSATLDCAPPVDPVMLLGAHVVFARDFDLDGAADAADTSWVSPADCGEAESGRIRLRRRFTGPPSVLRAMLRAAADTTPAAVHDALAGNLGGLLGIARYCARPKNGEPEWIAVANRGSQAVSLARVRLEGRSLAHAGVLEPGAMFVAGADTAELALWQPGARRVALSSWAGLRNAGDTLRLSFETLPVAGKTALLVLDSVIYGAAAGFDGEACASLAEEGSGAAAAGFELVLPAARVRASSGAVVAEVRAGGSTPYDLFLHDLDGVAVCALARGASGSAAYRLAPETCPGVRGRTGTFILHLRPRGAPGARRTLRLVP